MNKNEKAKIELQKGIEIAIQKAIDDAPFDKIETGIIKEVTNNGYTVLINKVLYYNIKTIGGSCAVNEVVKIVTPQNQSNNMFILKSSSGGSGGNVNSVNGKVGDVILNANDVGALPSTTVIPNKTSQLTNDSNYVSDINYVHTDNNYTTTEKNKLSNIESNAQINTVNSVDGEQGNIELNDVKYTTQTLTDNQKTQARTNIGAGTSSFSGDYSDLSNKPTIPTVGNGTITFTQNGTSKGTITTNQSGDTTIALTDNNTTYGVATSNTLGLVKSGTDITVDTSGNVSVNDDSHNHVINNVDGLQSSLDSKYSSSNPQTNVSGSSGSCIGNSATSTKLQTSRNINGVSFDGSSDITIEDNTKLPLSGGVLSEKLQINSTSSDILTVNRNNRDYYALIKFSNQLNGLLGYIGMGGSSNGGLTRWNSDGVTSYTMLDSNNYANIIPIATTSVNGLMNFSDKTFMTKLNQEVGTFTPKFANTNYPNGVPESTYTVDGYCYYTVRNGYYQRIGNVVYVYSTMRGYYRITNLENYQKQAMIVGLPFAMYGDYQTPISIGASSNVFNTYGTTTDCSTNAKATVYNGGLQFWNSNGINSIDLRYSTSMFFLSFAGTYLING